MNKTLFAVLFAGSIIVFMIFGMSMCGQYKEKLETIENEKTLLRAERDSLEMLYQSLEEKNREIEQALTESRKRIEQAQRERRAVVAHYEKRIAEINEMTPDEIHEAFNETYPTQAEGPLHVIVSDQARQAVSTKIELDQAKEELSHADDQIAELGKMVSLQSRSIEIKDEQLALKQREIDLMDERYQNIIRGYEQEIKRMERRQRMERITFAGSALVLLGLLIF